MPTPKARMGIIGGAGPMAGALLFNKIIKICQQRYACASDADFPFISLVNYPFADMLTTEKNHAILSRQLDEVFRSFTDNRISICAIACNTLHTYLPPIPKELHLVHMIKETARVVSEKNPLVLCTSLPILEFSTTYEEWKLEKNIPNGIPKEMFLLSFNKKKYSFFHKLKQYARINKYVTIPEECDYTNPDVIKRRDSLSNISIKKLKSKSLMFSF